MEVVDATWKDYIGWIIAIVAIVVAILIARWQIRRTTSDRRERALSQEIESGNNSENYQAGGDIRVEKK